MKLLGLDVGGETTSLVELKRRGTMVWLTGGVVATSTESEEEGAPTDRERFLALRRELQAARLKAGKTALGLPGKDSSLRYLHLPPVPRWRLDLIMQYEMEEVEEKLGESLIADYRILTGVGEIDDGSPELLVLVAMAKDAALDPRVEALERIGIPVVSVLPRSVALFNAFRCLGLPEAGQTDLVVDIGRDGMDLVIQQDGFLIFARSLSEGGEAFTERIAAELELEREEAELRKRRVDEEPPDSPLRQVLNAAYGKLAGTLRSTLLFARSQTRINDLSVDRIWITGGGARAHGLSERLETILKTPVEIFDVMHYLETDSLPPEERAYLKARSLELTIAVGLAMIDDHPAAIELDLLPERVRQKMEFRQQTVPLVIAAVLVLLYLGWGGIQALSSKSHAEELNTELQQRVQALEGRQQQMVQTRQGNEALQLRYGDLARRTDPNAYLVRLVELLHSTEGEVRQRLSIDQVGLGPPDGFRGRLESKGAIRDVDGRVVLGLSGEVDDSVGEGTRTVRQLVETIEDDPWFERAEYRSLSRADGRLDIYPFEILVVTAEQ